MARVVGIANAVVYGVVPRIFDPPGFAGVTSRLDDLADLGVSDLWLAPITATNPGSYGYDVIGFREIRPDYGTREEFRALVAAAHARGLRVLIDFVPNHTSVGHSWFRDAAQRGEASPYWDWYDRDDAGEATHYFTWKHLPNLNYGHPALRRSMLEAFSFWVREFDVDGFRIDAVWGIRQRHPAWLEELVAAIRRIKPNALLIAEASAHDPFYLDAGFDAAYDWTDALGHWAWEDVFGGEQPIAAALTAALTAGGQDPSRVLRFLNNNDTGPRFLSTHGAGCYRVALAMLLTLPGIPCLFTGDEVGAEFEPYEQATPIDCTDRSGLRNETKRLIALRRDTPALHAPGWVPLHTPLEAPLFAYLRTDTAGDQPVLVALNFSPGGAETSFDLSDVPGSAFSGPLRDLWSGDSLPPPANRCLTIPIPGWGYRLVTPDRG